MFFATPVSLWSNITCFSEDNYIVVSVQMAYLKLCPLGEEVLEQYQHVRGHCGHVGSIAIWTVGVAKASAHRIVYK